MLPVSMSDYRIWFHLNKDTQNRVPSTGTLETSTVDCKSTPNPEGQVLPASDRETCPRGCEGLVTQAVD